MASDLYTIDVYDASKKFEEVMEEHELGLSIAIVKKISEAINNDLPRVNIAKINTDKISITLHASAKYFEKTLQTNIDNLIKYEEYELCSIGTKAIEKLKNSDYYKKYLEV